MAFLDKLGKTIGNVADSASEKAKDFAETTKLNSAISSEEKSINQCYIEIGKFIYEQDKDNSDSSVSHICDKISASMKNIEDLKQRIIDIKKD